MQKSKPGSFFEINRGGSELAVGDGTFIESREARLVNFIVEGAEVHRLTEEVYEGRQAISCLGTAMLPATAVSTTITSKDSWGRKEAPEAANIRPEGAAMSASHRH